MSLESLWAGWRMAFIDGASQASSEGAAACILCTIGDASDEDRELRVIHRAKNAYVVMNIYPYTSGHLMVIPYLHTSLLNELDESARIEIFELLDMSVEILEKVYKPQGFNIGLNLGRAAGAGIADHLHFHVVPRWNGDTNFMTTVANVRVQPESLEASYERIISAWDD